MSEEYNNLFHNEKSLTEALSDGVLRDIVRQRKATCSERPPILPRKPFVGNVDHVGARATSVGAMTIAHRKGEDQVFNAAKALLDNLFLTSPFL